MGLALAYIDQWKTIKPGNRKQPALWDIYLLNTNRMVDITDRGLGYAKFLFHEDPNDRRDSHGEIEAWVDMMDSVGALRFYHDLVYGSLFHTFGIYPNMDRTATPVNTDIAWENISHVWATRRDNERGICHMVYYNNDFQRVTCLCDTPWIAIWLSQT